MLRETAAPLIIYGVQRGRRLDRFLDRFLEGIRRFWGPRGRVWTPRGLILGPGEVRAPLLGAGGGSGTSPAAIFRGLSQFLKKSEMFQPEIRGKSGKLRYFGTNSLNL